MRFRKYAGGTRKAQSKRHPTIIWVPDRGGGILKQIKLDYKNTWHFVLLVHKCRHAGVFVILPLGGSVERFLSFFGVLLKYAWSILFMQDDTRHTHCTCHIEK